MGYITDMTKTQIAKLAKQSTQRGYFDKGATLEVGCPLGCGRVSVSHSMWATDGKGKRMSKVAQLQREVSEHITWEHGQA